MISLDQVLLLEQKVESAVEKIIQLKAENDALRKKCAELTNAVSAKTEQLSTFETDQNQIENGIKKALDRLNSIENSFLKTVNSINKNSFGQAHPAVQKNISGKKTQNADAQTKQENQPPLKNENPEHPQKNPNSIEQNINFDSMTFVNQSAENQIQTENYENIEEMSSEQNFEDELFEENQNETEEMRAPSEEFSDNFDEELSVENSPDEDSDDDLGFDIF